MLQHLVANWLRQQAQEAVMNSLNPDASADTEAGNEEDPQVDIVHFFASAAESGGFVDKLTDVITVKCNGFVERIGQLGEKRVVVVEVGLSHEKLARVVRDVVSVRKPKWALSCGFSVGVDESIRKGDIVVAERIIGTFGPDESDYSLNTGTKMPESRGLRVGTMLCVPMLPDSKQKKLQLSRTGALACDTQSAVTAEVCRISKVPMMSIHCVAESLSASHNQIVKKVKSQDSIAGMIGAAAGALLDQPGSVQEFWNDKESSLRLSDRLAGFLVSVVQQLP